MKIYLSVVLTGLLVEAAPSVTFADCSPACTSGNVCRVTTQGPPTVYGCLPEKAHYVRSPKGSTVGGGSSSDFTIKGPAAASAKTTAPKRKPTAAQSQAVQSPRDTASGVSSAFADKPKQKP